MKTATTATMKTATAAAVASPAVLGKGRNGQPNNQCERNCGDALHVKDSTPVDVSRTLHDGQHTMIVSKKLATVAQRENLMESMKRTSIQA